jgi:hypothetical protein
MLTRKTRLLGRGAFLALALLFAPGAVSTVDAAIVTYTAVLDGPSEAAPNASPGIGTATVEIDVVAHTLHVVVSFSGLLGTTTASHIHAPTAVPLAGAAGVATMTPSFAGFPLGVTSGTMDRAYDLADPGSFNAPYLANNGATAAGAEAALAQALADGRAYLNIHSTMFTGGEIRGFLVLSNPTPTEPSTWGRVKALYR